MTHTGIFLTLIGPADPAEEAGWNKWHAGTYVPAFTSMGLFPAATRYRRVYRTDTPGDVTYLTLYETSLLDPQAAYDRQQQAMSAKTAKTGAVPDTRVGYAGVYKLAKQVGHLEGRRLKGIMIALTICTDPAREREFEEWYDRHHLAEIVAAGSFFAGAWYVASRPAPGDPKYLAIYQTDWEDLERANAEVAKTRNTRTPTPDTLQRIWGAGFVPVHSC